MRHATLAVAVVLAVAATLAHATYDAKLSLTAAYFTKAAMCTAAQLQAWDCGIACTAMPSVTNVSVLSNLATECQSYVAYSPAHNMIVWSFRGTDNADNWIVDLTMDKVAYGNATCGGCMVHKGFFESYTNMSLTQLPQVQALAAQYPTATILTTGHSLGAAQAQFAGIDVWNRVATQGRKVMYNFGTPRVGDAAFAAWAAALLPAGAHYHVTHGEDPVPHMPPLWMGFLHFPREVFYSRTLPAPGFVVCDGTGSHEDSKCSDQYAVPTNITAHHYYMGLYLGCNAGPAH
jgi:predicted lipase